MREIKFRAWDTQAGKMSLPFNAKEDWGDYLIDFGDYNADGASKDMEWLQYTGLKDKNGAEIYEGDVVSFSSFEHGVERRVVVYSAPSFWLYKRLDDHIDVDQFSTPTVHEAVIGNIYENPELLEAKS